MDGDEVSEMYRALRKQQQVKRATNRSFSTDMLKKEGIRFTSFNDGAHLVVLNMYDFWPGTGLWISRLDKTKRRGYQSLIAHIKKEHPDALPSSVCPGNS